ncbi:OTU domain-containing protein 5-A-like [Oppia nitens]|uniref:OTU domain-containing protein 5-A-like n=1 Tax=Oppia nitens TaxID=1686743 RepID=UPI0023DAC547|nr:OTU domain-containing protein 5-A-like [Oppia nitens]XP_054168831.1 OTU domain-containing protein 5-A-like [Oppia nitens]
MTILPKKKNPSNKQQQQQQSSGDDSVDQETRGHNVSIGYSGFAGRGPHNGSHSVVGSHSPQSSSRWRTDDKRGVQDSDGVDLLESGQPISKRRHRRVGADDRHDRLVGRKGKSGIGGSGGVTPLSLTSNGVQGSVGDVDVVVGGVGVGRLGVGGGGGGESSDERCSDQSSSSSGGGQRLGGVGVGGIDDPMVAQTEAASGYNSGDEYERPTESKEEWEEKERVFAKRLKKKGFIIKQMGEDGACLFRAVADQIYGDQEMHASVRKLCMDYMAKNGDYFSQYVTEDFGAYIERKRLNHIHGNHIEMQAMSEIFNRPIEVYHYSCEPINIFQGCHQTDNEPIRLSYHKNIHYNSIVNPHKATIGLGLGLPALKPGFAEKSLMDKAIHISEQQQLEQAMLEDKIRATDWEATNEAIEEQIARESYVEWLKENEMRHQQKSKLKSTASSASSAATSTNTTSSAAGGGFPLQSLDSCLSSPSRSSPKASGSGINETTYFNSKTTLRHNDFSLMETASSFINDLPPQMFGLKDWTQDDILAKVLAQSQEEYIESLKRDGKTSSSSQSSSLTQQQQQQQTNSQCKTPPPSSSSSSNT